MSNYKIENLKDRVYANDYACSFIERMDTCLDIGCGINPQKIIIPNKKHHLSDPHKPYLEIAKDKRKRDGNIHVATWEETLNYYDKNSVNTVFLVDVIEHLEKSEGEKLLPKTLDIVDKQIFIFTPYGFLPQPLLEGNDPWDLNTGGNELQVHRSGWLPEDFKEYNATIFTCMDYHVFEDRKPPLPNGTFGAMWVIINK